MKHCIPLIAVTQYYRLKLMGIKEQNIVHKHTVTQPYSHANIAAGYQHSCK